MISTSTKLLAAAVSAVILAGCNAVEDVREAPFTPVPAQGVVLQGKVTGTLGRQRALTLLNNGNNDNARSISATLGVAETPFTFGPVPAGSTYNVTVKAQPYGKICTVSGGQGTVTTPEDMHIVVNCVNDPAVTRYAVRVTFNTIFAASQGAKVTLTTEEGVYEKTPAPTDTFVQFDSAVFHNVLNGVTYPPAFTWTVTASNTAGSLPNAPLVNKCLVTNGTNPAGASPTGNVGVSPAASTAWPTVGTAVANALPAGNPCEFTIGSTVAGTTAGQGVYYSTPPNGTPQTMPTTGLALDLKDVTGKVLETLNYTGGYGTSGTTATATTNGVGVGYAFATIGRSNPTAVYDVAVSRQPTGQTCIVHNGGAATLGVATANITNAHVACRAKPVGAAVLRGTYEFRSGVTFNYPATATAGGPVVSSVNNNGTIVTTTTTVSTIKTRTTYKAPASPDLGGRSKGQDLVSDTSTRVVVTSTPPGTTTATTTSDTTTLQFNVASSNTVITRNFLTFFDDGTFLYGVHGNNQVEHGFYNYNPTTRVINFTLITDAFTAPASNTSIALTSGLSGTIPAVIGTLPAAVNPITWGGVTHPTMANVVKTAGAMNTLSGDFGPVDNVTTVGVKWAKWALAEPGNVAGQMTGTWVSPDHRRAWNYDFNTTLGFHVGVNGGAPNMQDGCFTFQDYREPAGFYTRRGGLTGCLDAVSVPAGIGTVDYQLPSLANTPGFVGRMPGTETAFDGRSPSPIFYSIGTAATFAGIADPAYFASTVEQPTTPTALTAACGTADVLGVRASLNGIAINKPVYFCRERVN